MTTYFKFVKKSNMKCWNFLFLPLLLFSSCAPVPPSVPSTDRNQTLQTTPSPFKSSVGKGSVLHPWQETEYIFYNKTGEDVRIVDAFSVPENIQSILLKENECAYIESTSRSAKISSSLFFNENSGELICGNSSSDVNNSEGDCAFKILEQREKEAFQRNQKSTVPYLEFYNVIDRESLFEKVALPVPSTTNEQKIYRERCKTWSPSQSLKFHCECLNKSSSIRDQRGLVKGIEIHFFANADKAQQTYADKACRQKVAGYNKQGAASYLEQPVPLNQVVSESLSNCSSRSRILF